METVLIGGGSGLVGTALSEVLSRTGFKVLHLSRTPDKGARFPSFGWDISKGTIDDEAVARADIIINLAGAGIADKRWSDKRKKLIIESRTQTAQLIHDSLLRTKHRPQGYISSSAIGYYGDRGDREMDEKDAPGDGFLSKSGKAWESSARTMEDLGIRTVIVRTGIVLSTKGGALERMIQPVHFGLAPYFGPGTQWYSWIHLEDIARIIKHAIEDERMHGVFNAVAPHPIPNKEFMNKLAVALGRKAISFPVPSFALRIVFGEMANTILDSTRVSSVKVEQAGFTFKYPRLLPALKDLL